MSLELQPLPSVPQLPVPPPPTPVIPKSSLFDENTINIMLGTSQRGNCFDSLGVQLTRKVAEQGCQFNLMCVGETSIGKTMLLESLFNIELDDFQPYSSEVKTVNLVTQTYDVSENGVHLKLKIVETAGFGDQLDKDKDIQVIVDYICAQYESYLKEELKVRRMLHAYEDTRIHACLYFISPTGSRLKALDLATLRELCKYVNVIPVIAKSDTIYKEELARFKHLVKTELKLRDIQIYEFPTDDDIVMKFNKELNALLPFAVYFSATEHLRMFQVVGSKAFVKMDVGLVRARIYLWGVVKVDDPNHCDVIRLREAILGTNFDALLQRTHTVHYEAYRRERLRQRGLGDGDTGPKLVEALAIKRRQMRDDLNALEQKLRSEFEAKIVKKEEEIRLKEKNLNERERDMEASAEQTLEEFDVELAGLLEEKARFEQKHAKKDHKGWLTPKLGRLCHPSRFFTPELRQVFNRCRSTLSI